MPVQAYDPVFTEVDRAVLAELGVRVRSAERLRWPCAVCCPAWYQTTACTCLC